MKSPRRICVSFGGFEFDRGSTGAVAYDFQTQKLADWSGKFAWRQIRAPFDNLNRIELSLRLRRVLNCLANRNRLGRSRIGRRYYQ